MNDVSQQRAVLQAGLTDVMLMVYEFAIVPTPSHSVALRRQAIEQLRRRVLDLRLRAGGFDWNTLHDACFHLEQNLAAWADGTFDVAAVANALDRWVSEVSAHTEHAPNTPLSPALRAWLRSQVWPVALDAPVHSEDAAAVAPVASSGATVLRALREELHALRQELETFAHADAQVRAAALRGFRGSLEVFGIAAAGAGYLGLLDACTLLNHAIARDATASPEWIGRVAQWCDAAQRFLGDPDAPRAAEALLELHRDAEWLPKLNQEDFSGLTELFHCDATTPRESGAAPPLESAPQLESAPEPEKHIDFATSDVDPAPEILPAASAATAPPVVLTPQAAELVQLVHAEVERHQARLRELLATMQDGARPGAERATAANGFAEQLQRFASGADTVGLTGLKRVFEHARANVHAALEPARGLALLRHFEQLMPLVDAYLSDFAALAATTALEDYVTADAWPVAARDVDALRAALRQPVLITEDENAERRPTQALPEHVTLVLPEDANPRLLESLLQELPAHTADFSAAVARMTQGQAGKHDVDVAQRIAHTLKGAANTVGVAGIAQLTHHIEDILTAYAKHNRVPGGVLAGVLQNASDALEAMSEHLLGQGSAPDNAVSVLQDVLDWANRIDRDGLPADADADAAPEASAAPGPAPAATPSDEEAVATLRVPATLIDELLRLVGESIIVTGQLKDRLRLAVAENKSIAEQNALFQKLTYELEQIVDVQGIAVSTAGTEFQDFDSLEMDQYNELHTVTRRLVEAATDSREMTQGVEDHLLALNELIVQQARTQKENQEAVMRTRMVPAQTLVPRLQRAVRQTCRLTRKNVELDVQGAETLVDTEILNAIVDPLMHLLRNAIDHGIEPETQRAAADKPARGRIELRFAREGDHMVITCVDDGGGIDFDAVRATARKRGWLKAGDAAGEAELTRLLLQPGFTTRSSTTHTSGRGIGLDAVNTRVLELKGTLAIAALRGQGCTIEIRLPLSLISVHALLINVDDHVVAASTRGVEQILHAGAGRVERQGDEIFHVRDEERLQGAVLEQLLDVGSSPDAAPLESRTALLVRVDASERRVVWIDQIVATQDLVVKQLGTFLPKLPGVEGATILGNGQVAAVLDLPELLRAGPLEASAASNSGAARVQAPRRRVAVVVDDSLSARRALAELMQDMGYEVHAARDGIEAAELLDQHGADIVLADLEMPRMNGLELAAHMRGQAALKDIPIVMVTSRSTEKHRQQAAAVGVNVYMTKPFTEDELARHVEQLVTPAAGRDDGDAANSTEHGVR